MATKAVAVGKGSLAGALSAVLGVPVPEKPQEPAITYPQGDTEEAFLERLRNAQDIGAFRELLRRGLAQHREVLDSIDIYAGRFDAHPGYEKLRATVMAIRDEMNKPEFDFGDPARLQRWINWMFQRKQTPPPAGP